MVFSIYIFSQVYVDNYKCGQIFWVPKVNHYWVSCDGHKGSTVKVTLAEDFLQLAEVQVFGKIYFFSLDVSEKQTKNKKANMHDSLKTNVRYW